MAIARYTTEFLEKFEQRRDEGYDLIDYEQIDDIYIGIYEKSDTFNADAIDLASEIAVSESFVNSLPSLI